MGSSSAPFLDITDEDFVLDSTPMKDIQQMLGLQTEKGDNVTKNRKNWNKIRRQIRNLLQDYNLNELELDVFKSLVPLIADTYLKNFTQNPRSFSRWFIRQVQENRGKVQRRKLQTGSSEQAGQPFDPVESRTDSSEQAGQPFDPVESRTDSSKQAGQFFDPVESRTDSSKQAGQFFDPVESRRIEKR